MTKYPRYQDYVIRDGRLVGEFEQMYQDFDDPWRQSAEELYSSDKAVGLHLLARLKYKGQAQTVLELGCGLGAYAARIAALGLDVTGVDISPTAVARAQSLRPDLRFIVGGIDDYELIKSLRPDVIVMSEISWYVLDRLSGFIAFLKRELPETCLLHTLNTYPPGVQQYGTEFFTDLAGIRAFFGMIYLDSGENHYQDGVRTWFLGTWRPETAALWNRIGPADEGGA